MRAFFLLYLSLFPYILASQALSGELRQWHRVTLTFDGPQADESATPNPFTDYRLNVTFSQGNLSYVVPGYFAADGNAGETSASSGDQWRVHFAPPAAGNWTYQVSFRQGPGVAIDLAPNAGTATSFDGATGTLTISTTDKSAPDNRAKGRLEYVEKRYRQYLGSQEWLINVGADAPENLLAYYEFDQTSDDGGQGNDLTGTSSYGNGYSYAGDGLHHFEAHLQDWNPGDPTWQNGKGKALIGALNYLASEGLNAFSGLLWNVGGDGDDIWPYTDDNEKARFDCSKLDQWELVFEHADQLGMLFHAKLFETENDEDMDEAEWKLYFREMIARFGHHLAWSWNLGEENTMSAQHLADQAQYFRAVYPFEPHLVLHTFAQDNWRQSQWTPQLGDPTTLSGISVQSNTNEFEEVLTYWLEAAENTGHIWVANWDEQGSANRGVSPDPGYPGNSFNNHDRLRAHMWKGFVIGMEGMKCYFGYDLVHTDLDCEDFRSRDEWWDYMRIGKETMTQVPFWEMDFAPNADPSDDNYVLTDGQDAWLIYAEENDDINLNLPTGSYETWSVRATDGLTEEGGIITGANNLSNGYPAGEDWVRIIRREGATSLERPQLTPETPKLIQGYFYLDLPAGTPYAVYDLTGHLLQTGSLESPGRLPMRTESGIFLYRVAGRSWTYGMQ